MALSTLLCRCRRYYGRIVSSSANLQMAFDLGDGRKRGKRGLLCEGQTTRPRKISHFYQIASSLALCWSVPVITSHSSLSVPNLLWKRILSLPISSTYHPSVSFFVSEVTVLWVTNSRTIHKIHRRLNLFEIKKDFGF